MKHNPYPDNTWLLLAGVNILLCVAFLLFFAWAVWLTASTCTGAPAGPAGRLAPAAGGTGGVGVGMAGGTRIYCGLGISRGANTAVFIPKQTL